MAGIDAAAGSAVVLGEKVRFASGATSTKYPRLDLIWRRALVRVSRRFELGEERHPDGCVNARTANQTAVLADKEFLIARATHLIDHAYKLIAKLRGLVPDDGDDDAGAIAWSGLLLCEAAEEREAKAEVSPEELEKLIPGGGVFIIPEARALKYNGTRSNVGTMEATF